MPPQVYKLSGTHAFSWKLGATEFVSHLPPGMLGPVYAKMGSNVISGLHMVVPFGSTPTPVDQTFLANTNAVKGMLQELLPSPSVPPEIPAPELKFKPLKKGVKYPSAKAKAGAADNFGWSAAEMEKFLSKADPF